MQERSKARGRDAGLVWGLAILVVGILWLLRELGAVPDISLWSLFWLGLGLWLAVATLAGRRDGWFWPIGFTVAGGVLLLRDLEVLPEGFSVWPVVLIVVGVSIVIGAVTQREYH